MLQKVLIANRGEIAVRIIRTLREMGITSVAAFSEADRDALFVLEADEAYHLGPAPASASYLNTAALLDVAARSGADAVHPGYGFLAENAEFADAVRAAGLVFIGPSSHALRTMGDKVAARRSAGALGVPLVPGSSGPVKSLEDARRTGREIGFPLAVKASGGGGGRGIRVVWKETELEDALSGAQREAESYFRNPEVYLERYFPEPRHVEVQVLGDQHGCLVHLGERDCSVQRRHQKLIEESPSPAVDTELRARMGEMALRAARSVDYSSAGTVEFLLAPDGEFYFLEMNTRIQVEHPVTEWVTGVDLIREMVLAGAGERITVRESAQELYGHAIEVRINAEDPTQAFQPTPATISTYREPGGPGTRVDTGVYAGFTIPRDYDSLIGKLICWAPDRERARRRTVRALQEFEIEGPCTTIPFHQATLQHPIFVAGEVTTAFLSDHGEEITRSLSSGRSPVPAEGGIVRRDARSFEVEVDRRLYRVRVAEVKSRAPGEKKQAAARTKMSASSDRADLVSPMHGTVIDLKKAAGDTVEAGEPVLLIEAMKMENEIRAHRAGTLTSILVNVGDTVETDQSLVRIE
jgi:acetyl-CoA/propionyl-CoA carboxylase, biotin carboxylase, biotin carboxyl carrier protein